MQANNKYVEEKKNHLKGNEELNHSTRIHSHISHPNLHWNFRNVEGYNEKWCCISSYVITTYIHIRRSENTLSLSICTIVTREMGNVKGRKIKLKLVAMAIEHWSMWVLCNKILIKKIIFIEQMFYLLPPCSLLHTTNDIRGDTIRIYMNTLHVHISNERIYF